MIEFDGVSCRYGTGAPVFENWSFRVAPRSITMIMGVNGAGKTTLLGCLTNQIRPYQGSIRIDGKPLSGLSPRELARLIAFVPQGLDRDIDYSVLDFIAFGRTPYLGLLESPSAEDYRLARVCAERGGVAHLAGRKVNAISGGERQLVYIARALAQETPVIVLDEPMSALDYSNQALILKIVSELAKEGKTIILTSHNPNHALAVSADALLIDRRKNILQGKAEKLLTDDKVLSETFGDQVHCVRAGHFSYIVFSL